MKVKVKAYSMSVKEILHFILNRGYVIGREPTPDNYDYRPKYIHYLEDTWGNWIVITAKSYNALTSYMKSYC